MAGDPNKEVQASKLVERLIGRFRGNIQDELEDINRKFTHTLSYSLIRRCVLVSIA